MRHIFGGLLFAAALVLGTPASAQQATVQSVCGALSLAAGGQKSVNQDTTGDLCVAATVNASISGFTPNGSVANLAVTSAGQNVALPTGTVVTVTNAGPNTAHIKLSVGAGSAATTDFSLVSGAATGLTVGSNTFLNAITASTETAALNITGGAGLVAGYGGGSSSGGGGGGAVTIADGADVTLGAKADAKNSATDTTPITAMQALKEISSLEQAPASRAVTNAGTFAVQSTTQASSNIIGKVGIDQTTPGTTNGVQVNAALPAGTNLMGKVGIDQTTPGTTNGVQVTAAIPAGSNILGKVSQVDSGGTDATDTTNHAVKVVGIGVAQGSTTSGQTLSPIGCRTLTSAPTDTTAQTNMPWCRVGGTLAVDNASVNGTATSTGTGAQGAGTPRVTVATDTATIAGSAPGTAGTPSANVVTVQGASSMTPILAQPAPATTGGLTVATITAANSTNATNLKGSAGQLYHITGYSAAAVPTWVSFYNTSGTPSCGTSIVYQVLIPVNSTSGGGAIDDIPSGLAFSSGIGYCITTGIAGTGSVAASSIVVNFGYK